MHMHVPDFKVKDFRIRVLSTLGGQTAGARDCFVGLSFGTNKAVGFRL